MTDAQIELIAEHYIIAAIWADCPEGTHPRATKEAETTAREMVKAFCAAHGALVDAALECEGYGDGCANDFGGERRSEWPLAAFGHDLYLTTHGHGVGFWDRRELGELGDKLTAICDQYKKENRAWIAEPEFYRGWLYLHRYTAAN